MTVHDNKTKLKYKILLNLKLFDKLLHYTVRFITNTEQGNDVILMNIEQMRLGLLSN